MDRFQRFRAVGVFVVALVATLSGCERSANETSDSAPFTIPGQVIGTEDATASCFLSKHVTPPSPALQLAGARVYLSADSDGSKPLSPVAISDIEGRFTLQVDPSSIRYPAMPVYWLIVDHPGAYRLATPVFNAHRPDLSPFVVVLKLRN